MSDPTPVIICGQQAFIANAVKQGLQPEYEVIHIILSPTAGASQIPSLLQGEAPPPYDTEQHGIKNIAAAPAAVIIGAGYDDEQLEQMRDACEGKSNVPWLRPDMSKPRPPLGPGYGEALVERVKVCLRGLAEQGKMNGDGIYFY